MKVTEAQSLDLDSYDAIIDVRSPSEFAEDHLPGARNLPVLDDDERARVGTIYKQESVFEARKIGAALVSRNIAQHIEGPLAGQPGGYKPLIYCWRGGQRSRAMALVFDQVGWPVTLLQGGYKAFRQRVLEDLKTLPGRFDYRVLAGLTGTGKTEILGVLRERGEQVLDLEGLANHQGSLLGAPEGGQNISQKHFDTRLWHALLQMEPARPVWSEAESAKIGKVFCPKALIEMLRGSLRIEIEVPMDERVRYLSERYPRWREDPDALMARLRWLEKRHGRAEIQAWGELARSGQWHEFVRRLLEVHYDPSYRAALDNAEGPGDRLRADDLLGEGCQRAADQLLESAGRKLPG